MWLFGYMERIRSSRALEKACLQVMPFLWLTGDLHPDHNTLWRFFRLHRKGLPKLFKKLVKTAAAAGLVGFVLHAIDGTKLTAASSTDEAHHRKSLEEKLARLDEFIATYMQEVNTTGGGRARARGYAMPGAMADAAARMAKIRALLERRIEDREDERLFGRWRGGGERKAEHRRQRTRRWRLRKPAADDGARAEACHDEGRAEAAWTTTTSRRPGASVGSCGAAGAGRASRTRSRRRIPCCTRPSR